jgi:hypothetical protein
MVSRIISKLPFNVVEKGSCQMLTWIQLQRAKNLDELDEALNV